MSLLHVRDEFLAARARRGDEAAFAELARRYRRLIWAVSRYPPAGLEFEDLCQEALIGLFAACRTFEPARGIRFAGWARLCVRQAIFSALQKARSPKQLVLTHALHDGDEVTRQLEHRVAAPAGTDPAVVVVLRDELRERAHAKRRRGPRVGG